MQLANVKKRRDVVWSREAKMRWLDNTGIRLFVSMFFMISGADYRYRYDSGC
jgi:hypothetical protein